MNCKKSKYRNQNTTIDGIVFDSKKEADTYLKLLALRAAGAIEGLARQVAFRCFVNGVLICTYRADFVYFDVDRFDKDAKHVVDVKGFRTTVYKLKKRLVEAIFGIVIEEL